MVRTTTNQAQDQNGSEYLMHEIALKHYPGWRIIQFSNFRSIYEQISGPLPQITGWFTLAVCLLSGGLLYGLYYKANVEINRRQKAEVQLRCEHEILDTVLSASPIGICLLKDCHIQWANDAFRELFGLKSRMDYEGRSTRILFPTKEEFDRVSQVISEMLGQKDVAETDAQMKRQDGSIFPAFVIARPTNRQQPMQQTIATFKDISAQIRAEEERVLKEKLHGVLEMAGAVCHEQNQPLMAINGYCTLVQMDLDPDHPAYSRITNIQKAAERISAMTNKLMNITRYKTCEYVGGTQIIDIDQSAALPGISQSSVRRR
jgi:PAS domain S-box-containing protein